jgi:uncharacterized protein (DUF433 family)
VLVAEFGIFFGPNTPFDSTYTVELAAISAGSAKNRGIAVGQAAAAAMLASRANEDVLGALNAPYTPGTKPGDFQPTPPTNIASAAGWAALSTFGVRSSAQFRAPRPYSSLSSLEYAMVTDLLASKDLYARPGELFIERYGQLISLNRAGQLGIQAVLQGLLRRIQWDKGLAVRFFPPLPNRPEAKSVMLDPRVSFGRSVLSRLGVSTAVIVDRINAGEGAADLVKDYGATSEEIMDALAYERAT